jgi:NAD(P)-dependent dehydrogenase (short-subunit alcohol dehydrogenase family)
VPLLIEQPGGLVVEMTTALTSTAVNRMACALAHELRPHGATAVALTPGWLRSEAMLDAASGAP